MRFTVVPPAPATTLPRMDIAGFVGFAASGPIDTPVPVEDPSSFEALFGDDLRLASDGQTGADVYSYLGPAVRAFFANGGQRCWIVRVARDAQVATIPVPGLVSLASDGTLIPTTLAARSAGSWADGVSVSSALESEPVEVLAATLTRARPQLSVEAPADIAPGDLIQLTKADRSCMLFIESVATLPPAGAGPATIAAAVDPTSLLCVRDVTETATELPREGATGTAVLPSAPSLGSTGATYEGVAGTTVTLALGPGLVPQPGQALVVTDLSGAEQLWLTVAGAYAQPDGSALRVQGRAQLVAAGAPPDAGSFAQPDFAERLTFDLFAQMPDGTVSRLPDLGFGQLSANWLGSLPSDEALYAPAMPGGPAISPPALWPQVTTPRWPLAASAGGDYGALYPIGMTVVPESWLTAAPATEDCLTRNGLATFDSRLFIDDGLRTALTTALVDGSGSMASVLLDEADYIRYTGPSPRPLIGLHALLEIEEVTLVCVPDAVQRGWTLVPRAQPSILASGSAPETGLGTFAPCAARALTPPVLDLPLAVAAPTASPPQSDEEGAFVLSWTPSDAPGAIYTLEQSISSGFSPATTFYQGPATSVTVHDLAGGIESGAGLWFRVRATAGAAQSGWSNALQVAAGPAVRAVVLPVDDQVDSPPTGVFSDSPLIEIQRALLRAAAARGDLFAALALPAHYNESETLAHLGRLFSASTTAPAADVAAVPPLDPGEARTLSFGALYHPWTVLVDSTGVPVALPADATAIAIMADRALSQGCWVAPANLPLTNAVALSPALDRTILPPGAVPQINVLSQEPIGFVSLSAWTLSVDPELTDINVRRLLSLLQRVAMLWGPHYVFEPDDPYLVHAVSRDFEALLQKLYLGGAFAGSTTAQSYFVTVLSGADPSSGLDVGDLVVEIGVAPSLPLRFLTVQLAQQYGGTTTVGGS